MGIKSPSPFSFLIGSDGSIYEGRGWNQTGAHIAGFNRCSISVSFLGNFNDHNPTLMAQGAYHRLVEVRYLCWLYS